MTPARVPLVIVRGDSIRRTLRFKDAQGAAIDVSGRAFTASIRPTPDSTTVWYLGVDDTLAAAGVIVLAMSADESAEITGRAAVWDVQQIDTDQNTRTIIAGPVEIVSDVTRSS